jgi:hypothetical protein
MDVVEEGTWPYSVGPWPSAEGVFSSPRGVSASSGVKLAFAGGVTFH